MCSVSNSLLSLLLSTWWKWALSPSNPVLTPQTSEPSTSSGTLMGKALQLYYYVPLSGPIDKFSGKDWYQGKARGAREKEIKTACKKTQCWMSYTHVRSTICKVSSNMVPSSRAHHWQPPFSCRRDDRPCTMSQEIVEIGREPHLLFFMEDSGASERVL